MRLSERIRQGGTSNLLESIQTNLTEEVSKILTITNGTDETKLDFNSLDFGFGGGDYFYNGNETGAQIGFYWNEDKGQTFIDKIFLNYYIGDETENDIETLSDEDMVNLTPDEELKITLSKEGYDKFLKWYDMCNANTFTYYNNLTEAEDINEIKLYMNTWGNYNENGADVENIGGGWMNLDQAEEFVKNHSDVEPFINDTEGNIPFDVDEYSNSITVIQNLKQYLALDPSDREALAGILYDRYNGDNFDECLNILNDGEYIYFPGVDNEIDLGKAYVDMVGLEGINNIENYLDRNAIAEDIKDDLYNNGEDLDTIDDDDINAMVEEDIQNAIDANATNYLEQYFDYRALGRELEYEGYFYSNSGAMGIFESYKLDISNTVLKEDESDATRAKFLTHILNGVIKTIQDNFKNVEATAEFDTTNTNNIVIKLKGNTLDLIDATSYLAKAVRNDDVDFKFDDNIENNTVTCYIQPK